MKKLLLVSFLASIVGTAGCGKSGVQRLDVSGSVTFDGQPVPAGEVRFEPNASKGGSGPVGYATIIDGRYDTRNEDKGPISGPVRLKVSGYTSGEAFAPPLFPPYVLEADLDSDTPVLDIEVPVKK